MKQNESRQAIYFYYFSKFLTGLRFFVPIWMIFGNRFLDISGLGALEAIAFFLAIIVDIPTGALADNWGRKKIIILGLLITAVGHILTGFSGAIWQYVLFCTISSIGSSFISGADSALIYDHLKNHGQSSMYIKVQSYANFAFRIGIIIAAFLGGTFYNISPGLPFILMGMMELVSILCWLKIPEARHSVVKFTWSGYFGKMREGVQSITNSSFLKPLAAFYTLVGGITFSFFWFFNYSYALELGFNSNQQSVLFGVTGIVKAIVILMIGVMYKKFTSKRVFLGYAIIMSIVLIPAAFSPMIIAVAIITVCEILGAARYALLDKFVNDEIESESRATTLSFVNMLINIVYLILVGFGASFAARHGTATLYSILGLVSLLIILPLAILLTRKSTPIKN
jgi:MFS family permease